MTNDSMKERLEQINKVCDSLEDIIKYHIAEMRALGTLSDTIESMEVDALIEQRVQDLKDLRYSVIVARLETRRRGS